MMDEREKLRKFRELDDAFAQALREMDGGSHAGTSQPKAPAARPDFEIRLQGLMEEYVLSESCVHKMLSTLLEYKKIS